MIIIKITCLKFLFNIIILIKINKILIRINKIWEFKILLPLY